MSDAMTVCVSVPCCFLDTKPVFGNPLASPTADALLSTASEYEIGADGKARKAETGEENKTGKASERQCSRKRACTWHILMSMLFLCFVRTAAAEEKDSGTHQRAQITFMLTYASYDCCVACRVPHGHVPCTGLTNSVLSKLKLAPTSILAQYDTTTTPASTATTTTTTSTTAAATVTDTPAATTDVHEHKSDDSWDVVTKVRDEQVEEEIKQGVCVHGASCMLMYDCMLII